MAIKNSLFVKVFHKEHQVNVAIFCILNGSVFFGSKKLKQELIAQIFATIAFGAIGNQDRVFGSIFCEKKEFLFRPTLKSSAIYIMVDRIVRFNPINKKFNPKALEEELLKLKKNSLVFLIGDFFEKPFLQKASKKHEIVVIVVRDPLEENPKDFGDFNLIDPQNGAVFNSRITPKVIKHYKSQIQKIDKELKEHFFKNKIRWTKIYTTEDPSIKLTRLFYSV